MKGAQVELALATHALRDQSDSVRQQAINIMAEFSFEPDDESTDRNGFFSALMDDDAPKDIRLACIHLLGKIGRVDEVTYLKSEIAKNSSDTRTPAESALFEILARVSEVDALRVALSDQLSISGRPNDFENAISNIDTASLELGLNHKDSNVRAACAREMSARDALTEKQMEGMLQDSSLSVRKQALIKKIERGETFDSDTLNKYMSKGERRNALSLFGTFDSVDTDEVEDLLILQLSRLPVEALRANFFLV